MTRVIKLGGRVQEDARLAPALAGAWRERPGALCVVHGGGDAISALQRALGVTPRFVSGRRVTSDADVEIVRMALSGAANKQLVARLVDAGVPAVGVSGEDGALIGAEPLDDGSLGRVGAPAHVDARLLVHLLGGDFLPVVSPLGRDTVGGNGRALNVNGDDAAAAIAAALDAEELLFVSDVPGVVIDGAPAGVLDVEEATAAIAAGVADGGMAAKLQAGIAALDRGLARVRIGDLDAIGDPGRGTNLVPSRSLV